MLLSRGPSTQVARPHRQHVIDAVDADQRFHLGADRRVRILRIGVGEQFRIAAERGERREMAAGGRAKQADALGIDAEFAGLAAHELHAGEHVVHRLRKCLLVRLRQPIADGEQRDAARGEMRSPILERVARAADPGAAMHGDDRRRSFRAALGQIEIARKLDAVMGGVGHALADIDSPVRHLRSSWSRRAKKSSSSRLASSARSMFGQWPHLSSTCSSAFLNFAASSLA